MCEEVSISILEMLKYLVPTFNILKLLTPIIIIIITIVDFFYSSVSGNQEQVMKTFKKVPIRIVTVILIFLIPTIVNNALSIIDSSIDKNGITCLLHVDDEVINNAKYKQVIEILENENSDKNDYDTAAMYISTITDTSMKDALETKAGKLALKIDENKSKSLDKVRERLKKSSALKKNNDSFNASAPYSSRGAEVAAYAKTFVGKLPYVWGGESLVYGADCSGFVQQVYAHFGVNISRTTYTQINDGIAVDHSGIAKGDYSKLKPGDLIICGGGSHVQMYIGNGQVVHESDENTGCIISPLSPAGLVGVRRIID